MVLKEDEGLIIFLFGIVVQLLGDGNFKYFEDLLIEVLNIGVEDVVFGVI